MEQLIELHAEGKGISADRDALRADDPDREAKFRQLQWRGRLFRQHVERVAEEAGVPVQDTVIDTANLLSELVRMNGQHRG